MTHTTGCRPAMSREGLGSGWHHLYSRRNSKLQTVCACAWIKVAESTEFRADSLRKAGTEETKGDPRPRDPGASAQLMDGCVLLHAKVS